MDQSGRIVQRQDVKVKEADFQLGNVLINFYSSKKNFFRGEGSMEWQFLSMVVPVCLKNI